MASATTRLTIGALLGMVGTVANTVTQAVETVGVGVSMLDKFASDAQERQEVRSIVDMDDFENVIREEKAAEQAQRQLEVLKFCNQSEDHSRIYQANYDRIGSLLSARRERMAKAA